jgi:hypothetical protein
MMLKTNIWMKGFVAFVGSFLIGRMFITGAEATNPENVVAQVTFVDVITINEINPLRYGFLDQNLSVGETVIIAPDSSLTDAGSNQLSGTFGAASLTVAGTGGESINILVDTITNGAGYTLAGFTCNYDAGVDTACGGAGYTETSVGSATLLIGATLTGTGTAVPGAADGNFNVTVAYQ